RRAPPGERVRQARRDIPGGRHTPRCAPGPAPPPVSRPAVGPPDTPDRLRSRVARPRGVSRGRPMGHLPEAPSAGAPAGWLRRRAPGPPDTQERTMHAVTITFHHDLPDEEYGAVCD